MPGSVMTLGSRWCSRSIANSTISAQPNTSRDASSDARAVVPPRRREHQRRQRFDDRIARPRSARGTSGSGRASTSKLTTGMFSNHDELRARTAGTPTPARRSTCRAAADRCRRSGSCRRWRRTAAATTIAQRRRVVMTAAPSAAAARRQREERRRRRQAARGRRRRARTACRSDRRGTPRSTRARTSGVQPSGGAPVGRVTRRRCACSASISSSARSCMQPPLGVAAQPVDFGRLRGSPPTSRATTGGRRPAPASSRRATSATTARQAPRWPCRTRRPPRGSRGATSSARTRCPPCTPTYRVERAIPFRGARRPDRAGPAPPGYASARNTAPNRYAMLKRGSSVVVMSSSGYSRRYSSVSTAAASAAAPAQRLGAAGAWRRRSTEWRGSSRRPPRAAL